VFTSLFLPISLSLSASLLLRCNRAQELLTGPQRSCWCPSRTSILPFSVPTTLRSITTTAKLTTPQSATDPAPHHRCDTVNCIYPRRRIRTPVDPRTVRTVPDCVGAASTLRLHPRPFHQELDLRTPNLLPPSRPHRQQHHRTAPHHGSWTVSLVTEATISLSQATGLDWVCQSHPLQNQDLVEKKKVSESDQRHHCPSGAQRRERCLQPHSKQCRTSQPQSDRILLSPHPRRPDRTRAAHHNRAETHTTTKLRQTRRHHQHVGHLGDPAAMAPRRIIINNKHNIILRRPPHRPRRRQPLAAHPLPLLRQPRHLDIQ
jgi:hypothetical protein